MELVNLALNTATSWPWYGYVATAVGVVVLIGLPFGAVIYALVSARGRKRKRLVVMVLTTILVIFVLLFAGNLWNHTHKRHGPSHAPGSTTSVPASHSS
jgi:MFS family permease